MTPSRAGRAGFSSIEMGLCFLIIAAMMAVIMHLNDLAGRRARMSSCSSNLRQIALALHMYCADNAGRAPLRDPLKAVAPYVKNEYITACPASRRPVAEGGEESIPYQLGAGFWSDDPPRTLIAWDPAPDLHPGPSWQGARLDGAVRRFPPDLWQPPGKEGAAP